MCSLEKESLNKRSYLFSKPLLHSYSTQVSLASFDPINRPKNVVSIDFFVLFLILFEKKNVKISKSLQNTAVMNL